MTDGKEKTYEFGDFRLNVARRLLTRRTGEAVELTPKALEILRVLVERSGRVVEKSELMEAVWPNTIVEESNLSQNVYTLRRALDDGGGHRYIATVPGRGYQFVAAVTEITELPSGKKDGTGGGDALPSGPVAVGHRRVKSGFWMLLLALLLVAATAAIVARVGKGTDAAGGEELKRLAVLPFKPLVVAERDAPLELGMTDSLISQLGVVRNLEVRPLTLVRRFGSPEQDPFAAGRELGVDAVLDGHVQRSGARVRVTARLLRVADEKQLWQGRFDEPFTDIFTVQDSISSRVVQELALHLNREDARRMKKRETTSIAAYESYLKARFFISIAQPRQAIELLELAIQQDPDFALAHAGLADIYSRLPIATGVPSQEPHRKARAAVARALALEPDLGEAHTALGWIEFYHGWNWAASEAAFRRAITINRNDFSAHLGYAHLLSNTGRHDEALRESREAIALDPRSPIAIALHAQFLFHAGRYDESLDQAKRALEINPGFWIALMQLGKVHLQANRYEEAVDAFRQAGDTTSALTPAFSLAYTMARSGRSGEARDVVLSLKRPTPPQYVSPYGLAFVQLGLGDAAGALELLERAYEERDVHMVFLAVDPQWRTLVGNPGFDALMSRMNLKPGGWQPPVVGD